MERKLTKGESLTTKELIDLWAAKEMPMRRIYFNKIGVQLYTLLEEGVLLSQIKLAIENYSASKWHRDNERFVNLFKFLSKEYIYKWQVAKVPWKEKKEKYDNEMMWALGERL